MSKLQSFNYNKSPIQFDEINGQVYANATNMAKAFNKRPETWLKTEKTKDYINKLTATLKSVPTDLVIVRNGGLDFGTWIHEKLVMRFAQWLSTEFELWVDEKIETLHREGVVSLIPTPKVPQTLSEALRLAADLSDEVELKNK